MTAPAEFVAERLPLVSPERARQDCQVLVASGLASLRRAEYWLLSVEQRQPARAWLAQLLNRGLVHSAASISNERVKDSVAVAVSHAGLQALGLQEDICRPFPQAFRDGMSGSTRATLLGDHDVGAWSWGDVEHPGRHMAHLWVAVFGELGAPPVLGLPGAADGLRPLVVATCPAYLQPHGAGGEIRAYEPFGFRDGIAQPWVPELLDPRSRRMQARAERQLPYADDQRTAMGEFVLGQLNGFGEPSHCPDLVGWPHGASVSVPRFASNGSYLAVRQIEQKVADLEELGEALAEKLVGRRRDDAGTPLVLRPPQDIATDVDHFRYRTQDPVGFGCPRGAHIRRANPRDSLGHDVATGLNLARLHRLIRRGRTYRHERALCSAPGQGDCGSNGHRIQGCGSGLMFVACNADLERQFEFVMQRWLLNPTFNDLASEDDPLLGRLGRITMPNADPAGHSVQGLPQLTRTLGGGYFLLPGLTALRFMAGL